MQLPDFDKQLGQIERNLTIATFGNFDMFKGLFASIGEKENGLEFPFSSGGGGCNNIKLNPVFRGMVFCRRIKIEQKIEIKNPGLVLESSRS